MRTTSLVLCLAVITGPAFAQEQPRSYKPPVMRNDGPGVSVWFGRVLRTGRWCAFDQKTIKRDVGQNKLDTDESGWARYDAHGLTSVTIVQENEDDYAEDQYFVDSKGAVTKMVRTGHYYDDPLASLVYMPDTAGRLRLIRSSKTVLDRMRAADIATEWSGWEHFSRLSQVPFAKLLDLKTAPKPGACQ